MRPVRRTALLLAAMCVVCLGPPGGASAARPEPPYTIAAGAWVKIKEDAPRPPAVTMSKTSLFGLTVTIEYVEDAKRAEYLKAIDPALEDPFAARPGGRPRALTFLVGFANDSKKIAVFQPGNVAMVSDHDERAFALDLSDMYMSAERAGVEDLQQVLDRSARIIFDSSTTIPSGGRLTRLLAFRPIEGKWRQFQLHFSFIQIGTETHTLTFTFHKEPLGG